MTERLVPRWHIWAYKLLVILLAVSGFSQMPISKRYYLADIPGLGWLADYYATHLLHYVTAILLLILLIQAAVRYLRQWRGKHRLTSFGVLRIAAIVLIVVSGVFRVLKNRPDIYFPPGQVILIDLVHLGSVFLLGIFALVAALSRRQDYLRPAANTVPR